MQQTSDEAIARHIQAGDISAFATLVDRYEPKMQRYIRRFLRRSEDVDDMVQEVFMKAYTNIQSFDISLRFSPWLYRIAHNACINEIKRQRHGVMSLFDFDTFLPALAASETADQAALEREQAQHFEEYLDQIDVKYSEPIILFFYESLSYQEISDILHIPIATVGVRIRRAKEKLRALIKKHEGTTP